jgi:hypothetical protein
MQNQYRIAYSPLYDQFVAIIHEHKDVGGELIYTGIVYDDLNNANSKREILFREAELDQIS